MRKLSSLSVDLFSRACLIILLVLPNDVSGAAQKATARPGPLAREVRAACDMAYAVAAKTPGTSIRRRTGNLGDETLRGPVFGCGLAITGSFARAKKSGDAAVRLRDAFEARGWKEMGAYSADGTDGTSFAFRKGGVSCLVRGTWNGGAADEPEVPAEDWYKVAVLCTSPAFPEER